MSQITRLNSAGDIEYWLVNNIAFILGVNPEEIDIQQPLDSYGLDSQQAMILASKAEKILGFKLSLMYLWYYPTIQQLAQRLAQELENSSSEILQI